jgi:hypothetical protein
MADEDKTKEQLIAQLEGQLAEKDSELADLRQQRAVEQAAGISVGPILANYLTLYKRDTTGFSFDSINGIKRFTL